MTLKLKKEYGISYSMDNLMDDDFVIVLKLSLFASNIKKIVYDVLNRILSFLKDLKKIKPIICYP